MKIYALEEYNTKVTACITENIEVARKQICNKEYFDPERGTYPIMSIWENGVKIEEIRGCEVLKRIAKGMMRNV